MIDALQTGQNGVGLLNDVVDFHSRQRAARKPGAQFGLIGKDPLAQPDRALCGNQPHRRAIAGGCDDPLTSGRTRTGFLNEAIRLSSNAGEVLQQAVHQSMAAAMALGHDVVVSRIFRPVTWKTALQAHGLSAPSATTALRPMQYLALSNATLRFFGHGPTDTFARSARRGGWSAIPAEERTFRTSARSHRQTFHPDCSISP